jgi:hypothetical protein
LGRLRGLAEGVVAMALFAILLSVIGLISELVGVAQQTPVQRGIDAQPVRVTGTFAEFDDGSKFHDPTYTLSYLYEGQALSTPLRSLPGNPVIGDDFCVEIDAEQPGNGRVCGTRGGLADAQEGLQTGAIFLGLSVVVLLGAWALHRWADASRKPPPRRPSNRKSRGQRERARRAMNRPVDRARRSRSTGRKR